MRSFFASLRFMLGRTFANVELGIIAQNAIKEIYKIGRASCRERV